MHRQRRVPGIPPCPGACRKCVALVWPARENDPPRADAASAEHKVPATGAPHYQPPPRRSDTGERRRPCCGRAWTFALPTWQWKFSGTVSKLNDCYSGFVTGYEKAERYRKAAVLALRFHAEAAQPRCISWLAGLL